MSGEAGKGGDPRPVDKKKYDACPLWKNLERKKKKLLKEQKDGKAGD